MTKPGKQQGPARKRAKRGATPQSARERDRRSREVFHERLDRQGCQRGPPEERCAFPGCPAPKRKDMDLCKTYHGGEWSPNGKEPDETVIGNDGILDEQAILITVRGERRVKLTWIERDMAIAMILGGGGSPEDVEECTGYRLDPAGYKYRRLMAIGQRYYSGGTHAAA